MATQRTSLPSLSSILFNSNTATTADVTSNAILQQAFHHDNRGIIRLPPLNATGINRPRSVDSALRHTASDIELVISQSQHQQQQENNQESLLNRSQSCATLQNTNTPLKDHVQQQLNQNNSFESPSTPIVKKKSSHKMNDMLTPLSAAKAIITPSTNDKKRAFAFITHSQETFPTKEPKIDNAPLARRKRRRTSTQELNILQNEFAKDATPDKQKRIYLAERCKMSEKAVQIWFQNRRQAEKRRKIAAEKGYSHNDNSNDNKSVEGTTNDSNTTTDLNSKTPETEKSIDNIHQLDKTPELHIPLKDNQVTPSKSKLESNNHLESPIPTRTTPPQKRGQALTFHLRTDKKILTPLKTLPNNRVNKLINGDMNAKENIPDSIASMNCNSPKKSSLKIKQTNSMPLKEIEPNKA
ncbi:hypothetical protein Kpol_1004p50 [Vanderwaltozyma polyspora DSM 70294]|uniref:Homeobox domain-containing protein n=1 Tax=Vanderwaltozyma polyspora (strain ATCC 22028 / DSM 70294 / BCRC 21397 / CBS 2163 / NBRC 10782 / NRRL Y-8283 / UCD 57-17) TaxID=436907 RepID=A7TJA6_VANPO|nr:uncharacterized protein Kpol_1004p50 [Vanderwaltozyma polyspora DSM 70294]EDO17675.1 hypothetical protein Kpol_1004p50 [Vanderwaltozyma polyspora DSM 70294]